MESKTAQKPLYGCVIGGKKIRGPLLVLAFEIPRGAAPRLVSVARTNSRPLATRHLVCANHTDPQKNLAPHADAEQGGEEGDREVQLPRREVREGGGSAAHPGRDPEGLGQRGVVRCVDAGQHGAGAAVEQARVSAAACSYAPALMRR